jgi:hypothetical protein
MKWRKKNMKIVTDLCDMKTKKKNEEEKPKVY